MLASLVLEFDMEPFPEDRQPEYIEFGGVKLLKENTVVRMRRRQGNSKRDPIDDA